MRLVPMIATGSPSPIGSRAPAAHGSPITRGRRPRAPRGTAAAPASRRRSPAPRRRRGASRRTRAPPRRPSSAGSSALGLARDVAQRRRQTTRPPRPGPPPRSVRSRRAARTPPRGGPPSAGSGRGRRDRAHRARGDVEPVPRIAGRVRDPEAELRPRLHDHDLEADAAPRSRFVATNAPAAPPPTITTRSRAQPSERSPPSAAACHGSTTVVRPTHRRRAPPAARPMATQRIRIQR